MDRDEKKPYQSMDRDVHTEPPHTPPAALAALKGRRMAAASLGCGGPMKVTEYGIEEPKVNNQPRAQLPAELPSIGNAKLPNNYHAAKIAIAECACIDECQDWADKAAALASYAKQVDDLEMENYARRIRARALERCGALLREIEPQQGGDRKSMGGHPPIDTRSKVATEAGLSEHARKTALRVANVPTEQFERMVESDNPPTIEQLAEIGTKSRAKKQQHEQTNMLKGREPTDFKMATRVLGLLNYITEKIDALDLKQAARGADARERRKALKQVAQIQHFLRSVNREMS